MRLLLIRHPPVLLAAGICYGSSEVPCARCAASKIDALRSMIESDAGILSSPRARCLELAKQLASHPASVRIEPRLQEMDFGEWELRAFETIDRASIDAWAVDPWGFTPPGGESAASMSARAIEVLDALSYRPHAQHVIVAHGGPLRVIMGTLLKLPRSRWLDQACEPGSVTTLERLPGAAANEYTATASGVLRCDRAEG